MILLLRLYYNFLKTVLQDTMSIKNRLQLNSLQQSVAPNKVAPISQPSSCNSTNVNHLCQYNAVSMIFPNVTWAFTTCRETLTELLKSVQVSIVTYLEVLFWTAYSLVSLFQTARPILSSAVHVASLFSKKGNYPSGIVLKHDLFYTERQIESILLKEHWQFLQLGVDRKSIKIRGSIYIYMKTETFTPE